MVQMAAENVEVGDVVDTMWNDFVLRNHRFVRSKNSFFQHTHGIAFGTCALHASLWSGSFSRRPIPSDDSVCGSFMLRPDYAKNSRMRLVWQLEHSIGGERDFQAFLFNLCARHGKINQCHFNGDRGFYCVVVARWRLVVERSRRVLSWML